VQFDVAFDFNNVGNVNTTTHRNEAAHYRAMMLKPGMTCPFSSSSHRFSPPVLSVWR
jgi:hypothetical protein